MHVVKRMSQRRNPSSWLVLLTILASAATRREQKWHTGRTHFIQWFIFTWYHFVTFFSFLVIGYYTKTKLLFGEERGERISWGEKENLCVCGWWSECLRASKSNQMADRSVCRQILHTFFSLFPSTHQTPFSLFSVSLITVSYLVPWTVWVWRKEKSFRSILSAHYASTTWAWTHIFWGMLRFLQTLLIKKLKFAFKYSKVWLNRRSYLKKNLLSHHRVFPVKKDLTEKWFFWAFSVRRCTPALGLESGFDSRNVCESTTVSRIRKFTICLLGMQMENSN